ncbi:MAG: leucyl/phenylalanyl-tRNA--protein transferase [Actinomycetes bacterium]
MPIEPPPCSWAWPDPAGADDHDVVGTGADLAPGTLLSAYRTGLFPMPVGRRRLAWFSPDPRGVLPLDRVHVSRSLRRSRRRFEVTVDRAFHEVVLGCATGREDGDWITAPIVEAYTRLHELGWAHSVEVWDEGDLVGGLYGVSVGGLFAGESMFHRVNDASKVALVEAAARVSAGGGVLFDVQWATPHLMSMGVVEIPRAEYLERLADATGRPEIDWGDRSAG